MEIKFKEWSEFELFQISFLVSRGWIANDMDYAAECAAECGEETYNCLWTKDGIEKEYQSLETYHWHRNNDGPSGYRSIEDKYHTLDEA